MRFVTFVLSPSRGFLDPCEEAFRRHDVVPRAVYDFDVLADGSVVTSYEVVGRQAGIHDSLAGEDADIVDYEIVDTTDTSVLQIHYYPCDLVADLLEIYKSYPTLLEFPLEYVESGRTRLRHDLVGPEPAIRDQLAELRRRVDVTIDRLGAYDPAPDHLLAELTARQREVLATAVEDGYYEVPREATHDELADELGCAPSTVGKHLRRIEAAFASHVAPAGGVDGSSEASAE